MRLEELQFTCPDCGNHQLVYNAITYVVGKLRIRTDLDTGEVNSTCDGQEEEITSEVSSHECFNCGFVIEDNQGYPITEFEDLVAWLREHQSATLQSDYVARRKSKLSVSVS